MQKLLRKCRSIDEKPFLTKKRNLLGAWRNNWVWTILACFDCHEPCFIRCIHKKNNKAQNNTKINYIDFSDSDLQSWVVRQKLKNTLQLDRGRVHQPHQDNKWRSFMIVKQWPFFSSFGTLIEVPGRIMKYDGCSTSVVFQRLVDQNRLWFWLMRRGKRNINSMKWSTQACS